MTPPPSLAAELATPLSPEGQGLAGAVRSGRKRSEMETRGAAEPGAVLALWRLLVFVMGKRSPGAIAVATWTAHDRGRARAWAERELARRMVGTEGQPSLQVPPVLRRYAR